MILLLWQLICISDLDMCCWAVQFLLCRLIMRMGVIGVDPDMRSICLTQSEKSPTSKLRCRWGLCQTILSRGTSSD